jgi:hypothetical protein
MKFSFDSDLITKARELILHRPNLNVLRATADGHYSPLVQVIDSELKKREAAGRLLLPDLSALKNQTIGIFSDYSGEGAGKYDTYSFLFCAWGSLDTFRQEMKKVRAKFALEAKEIEFKDFGMGAIQRALPSYLDTLNGYVPGLLFNLIVDKRIHSLFGPQDKGTGRALARLLEDKGIGGLKPRVAEKTLRVVHTAAYFTALLGHESQKIFWMSDHDAICANEEMHNRMLALYQDVLSLYSNRQFGLMGGARPFQERKTDFLDLLSAADIAAGSVGQYFTGRDEVGAENTRVKVGAEKVLMWLGHDAVALKKLNIMFQLSENGALLSGAVDFTSKVAREDATFLPTQLCL